jgi:hypothetical protein
MMHCVVHMLRYYSQVFVPPSSSSIPHSLSREVVGMRISTAVGLLVFSAHRNHTNIEKRICFCGLVLPFMPVEPSSTPAVQFDVSVTYRKRSHRDVTHMYLVAIQPVDPSQGALMRDVKFVVSDELQSMVRPTDLPFQLQLSHTVTDNIGERETEPDEEVIVYDDPARHGSGSVTINLTMKSGAAISTRVPVTRAGFSARVSA